MKYLITYDIGNNQTLDVEILQKPLETGKTEQEVSVTNTPVAVTATTPLKEGSTPESNLGG